MRTHTEHPLQPDHKSTLELTSEWRLIAVAVPLHSQE